MPEDKHTRGTFKGQFCTQPAASPCGDCPGGSTNYIDVCKSDTAGWGAYSYYQLRSGMKGYDKVFEAHHILCVSEVTKAFLADGAKVEPVVKETKWCINQRVNMIALPLWGHTVKWYCSTGSAVVGPIAGAGAPAFQNLPQHNFDHGRYNEEVMATCERIANRIEKSSEAHELKAKDLKSTLDTYSKRYDAALKSRGKRRGGTHQSWTVHAPAGDPTWCYPFSMASTGDVTSIDYPGKSFTDKLKAWVERLANSIKGKAAGR